MTPNLLTAEINFKLGAVDSWLKLCSIPFIGLHYVHFISFFLFLFVAQVTFMSTSTRVGGKVKDKRKFKSGQLGSKIQ